MRPPMAVVSIGGIVSATLLTLYTIPLRYYSFETIRKTR